MPKKTTYTFKMGDLKIKNRNLVNQLTTDELLYLHIHLTQKDNFEKYLGDLSFPLTLSDFEIAKKRINLKKIKREGLICDILDIIAEDDVEDNGKWFKTEIFESPKAILEHSAFYLLYLNLMTKKIFAEIKNLEFDNIMDIIERLNPSKGKNLEYNCLKAMAGLYLTNKFDELKDEEGSDNIKERLADKMPQMKVGIITCVHNNYSLICKSLIGETDREITRLKDVINKDNMKIDEKNKKIKELRGNIAVLEKNAKDVAKNMPSVDLEPRLIDIQNKLKTIEEYSVSFSKEMKENKKDLVKTAYENQIDNYITRVSDLKKELTIKNIECKDLKKNLEQFEKNIDDNFIAHVKVNGLSNKVLAFIKSYLGETSVESSSTKEIVSMEELLKEEIDTKVEIRKDIKKIGYVVIEDNKHFVRFMDDSVVELAELSDKIFLAEGQFVVVDENNRLAKTTISKYEDNGISIKKLRLGVVECSKPLTVRVGSEYVNVRTSNDFNAVYKPNQVVGLNELGFVVRSFRMVRFNADEVMKSIKARGITPYYVLDTFSNGYYKLRDIETGKEDIHNINVCDIELVRYGVVFLKDNNVVSSLPQNKFYTMSSYYKNNISFGYIEISNGDYRLVKQTGEIVLIKNIYEDSSIKDGDVVAVDEFNNLLYRTSTDEAYIVKPTVKKTSKQVETMDISKKSVSQLGEITIVGNLFYKNSYTSSFSKCGYKVNVLHGYDTSINKIVQTAKDSQAIIVNTSYCSHDNFWQIKDEVKTGALKGIKYMFTQEDGANMLLHKFMEMEPKNDIKSDVGAR